MPRGTRGNGPPFGIVAQGPLGIPGVYAALDLTGPLVELMKRDGAWGIWKCDEASGSTILDYSGNGRDQAITGAPSGYRTSVGGNAQYGMSWPGTTTDRAQTSATATTAGVFTLEALIWFSANPSVFAGIIGCDNGSNTGSFLQLGTSGVPRFQCSNSGGSFRDFSSALALNTLHHVVGVNSGGTMRLRVNGVSAATVAKAAANNGQPVKIHGGLGNSGGALTTAVCAYYDGIALTDTQIDEHYAMI